MLNSESESDENVDDLLSEYQHFLEKAHKQRKYYLEKTKLKNKVPLYRHDTYAKNKSGASTKYDDYTNLYKSGITKFPRSYYNSPLEFLIPMNSQNSYYSNIEIAKEPVSKIFKNNLDSGIKRSDFPSFMPYEFMTGNQNENKNYITPEQKPLQQTLSVFGQTDKSSYDSENAINIRIKVEIQAPKFQGASSGTHHCRNHTHCKQRDQTDVDSAPQMVTLPFSYYNLPIPLEMLSIKAPRNGRPEGAQFHKVMIHKKKKTRPSSASKKHRKKLISFHDVKFDPRAQATTFFVETFTSPSFNNLNITNTTNGTPVNITQKTEKVNFNPEVNTMIVTTTTVEPIKTTETQGNDVIYLTKNISIHENVTDDNAKNENSVEVDDLKVNSSGVTEKAKKLRKRREITMSYTKNATPVVNITENPKLEELKKVDHFLPSEPELLYWPNKNTSTSNRTIDNNITVLILERENKKAKLNISKETIRLNHQRTLEKAIFGDVNWDDVDTVAPEFMSFVGKYIKGVLTFCSATICHSMKCAQKECIHRICKPSERHNNNGHCVGSNSTGNTYFFIK